MINPDIAKISAYKPPLAGRSNFQGLLLDFNESTLPPGPKVFAALSKFLAEKSLQLYPEYFDLDEKIAAYARVRVSQVIMSNGSDQLIDMVFRVFSCKGSKVYVPRPSFAMFFQAAAINGCKLVDSYEAADLIVICNPNNPSGQILTVDQIELILKAYPKVMVFVDEAYFEFSQVTVAPLIDKYKNLIVSRTFSKAFGLAALRIGYGLSSSKNIKQMLKVRGPYDVNSLAVAAASAALSDLSYMYEYRDEVMNEAKPLLEDFFRKEGIDFVPSAANFIYFKPKASKVFEILKEKGVLVRPRENAYLRVSIGTVSQVLKLIQIYKSNFLS